MPEEHSHIGGSVANRIINCPWSLAHIDEAPPQIETDAAAEGTALHDVLEMFYTGKIDSITGMIGVTVKGVTLDEDQIDRALEAAQAFDKYIDQIEEVVGEKVQLWFERRVHFPAPLEQAFGTCDVLFKCGWIFGSVDWKFGRIEVHPKENAQLLFYGKAAYHTIPELAECTQVELSIIQPANFHTIQTWPTTPERLDKFEAQLQAAVGEARGKYPTCKTGSHCKWCPLTVVCPERKDLVRAAAQASEEKLDIPDLIYWYEQEEIITAFMSSVRGRLFHMLENGVDLDGKYKLVHRRSNRTWNEEIDYIQFFKDYGLSFEQYMTSKVRSPAQIEKLLKADKVKIPKELIAKKPPSITMAPMSDKRPDINEHADLSAMKNLSEK